ncbi:MAG: hypothetical protein OXU20_06170 [Myxococcales bacterium]|nr:hypothetical protein [Myxococcales bacterium]
MLDQVDTQASLGISRMKESKSAEDRATETRDGVVVESERTRRLFYQGLGMAICGIGAWYLGFPLGSLGLLAGLLALLALAAVVFFRGVGWRELVPTRGDLVASGPGITAGAVVLLVASTLVGVTAIARGRSLSLEFCAWWGALGFVSVVRWRDLRVLAHGATERKGGCDG